MIRSLASAGVAQPAWPLFAAAATWAFLFAGPPAVQMPLLCGGGGLPPGQAVGFLLRVHQWPRLVLSGVPMLFAMTLPFVVAPLGHVAARAGPSRAAAQAAFLLGYALPWAVALPALGAVSLFFRWLPYGVGVCAWGALLWQETAWKLGAHRRCHARPPLRWGAVAAVSDSARFGARAGWWCVASCWASMLLAMSIGGLPAMLLATAIALLERERFARPLRGSRLLRAGRAATRRLAPASGATGLPPGRAVPIR